MSETFLHGVQLLEVETGTRPIRSVRSSVIGLVGTAPGDGSKATATAGGLLFSSREEGPSASNFTVQILVQGNNSPLSVTKGGSNDYSVKPATSATGVATSTLAQIIAYVNSLSSAAAPFTAALTTGSVGTTVSTNAANATFTGGSTPSIALDTPFMVTSLSALINGKSLSEILGGTDNYLYTSLAAIFKQAGAVVIVSRTSSVASVASDTGVYALKSSQSSLGYTPRILICENAQSAIEDVKSVASSLRATALVGYVGTASSATSFASSSGNDRTMCLWPTVNGGEDPAPYAAGLLAKSDNDRGFWWSPSNQEVFGIDSLDLPVDFQLGDSSSLANVLNEGKVTTFIRQGGFRLWGNLTGSVDAKYQFLSVRRTADIINDSILTAHLWAVDRNISKTYLEDVAGSVNDYLKTLVNLGAILGGTCWPDPDLNSPDQIALGKVYFNFDFTPPYPAQTVTFRSILTNSYLSELL